METVGERLRAEREKNGLSIKDVEMAISIRALYINAIEEGNYTIVPGEVYLKGFIRNYANYLGLDGQEMVASYRLAQQPLTPEVVETSVEPEPTVPRKHSTNNNSGKLLIISLLVVCVAGVAWWAFASQSPTKEPLSTKQQEKVPAPVPTAPIATQSATPTVPASPAQSKPVVVIANYSQPCWTSVVADGKTIYEGTPKSGDTITWQAEKNITVTAGNAGGIDITYNGQATTKMGQQGEVLVKTYVAKQ